MLPTTIENETPKNDFDIVEEAQQPTKTYNMILNKNRVVNYTDGQAAMRQAIFKILQTERYQHNKVYSDNYGVEFYDLYGQPTAYCVPEIERRITEALTWDDRILQCINFSFEIKKKVIAVSFTAVTIFGNLNIDNIEVNV